MRKPVLVAIAAGVFVTAGLATFVVSGQIKRRAGADPAQTSRQRFNAYLAGERQRQLFEQKGTKISPHPDLKGVDPGLLKTISRQFAVQKDVPAGRLAHFREYDRPDFGLRGWYGTIRSVEPSPNGWLVTIFISPHLVSEGASVTYTTSRYIEQYELTDDGLRFISGQGAPGLRATFID